MKKIDVLFISGILLILIFTLGCSNRQAEEIDQLKQKNAVLLEIAGPLPASLDSLFPPIAGDPLYLMAMLKMNTRLNGILVDLLENDPESAMSQYERFKTAYVDISKMVPEWEKKFPIDVVDTLDSALRTKNMDEIMGAYQKVGQICYDCHVNFMVKVQQKYHWGDFGAVEVRDPLSGETTVFSQFKHALSSNLDGIGIDLEQGEYENAQKQFQAFNFRFQTLKETCKECHLTERTSYVNPGIQSMIDKLGKTISEPTIEMERVSELVQGIGMESCFNCHLVHLPSWSFRWSQARIDQKF